MLADFESIAVNGGTLLIVDHSTKFVERKTPRFFNHGVHMYSQGVDIHDCFPGLTHDELKFLRVGKFDCTTE